MLIVVQTRRWMYGYGFGYYHTGLTNLVVLCNCLHLVVDAAWPSPRIRCKVVEASSHLANTH